MSAATITNLAQLEAAYARDEQLAQEAAEAEHTAFVTGQDAYGAYEVACDDAATAPGRAGRRAWSRSCGARPVGPGTKAGRAPCSTHRNKPEEL